MKHSVNKGRGIRIARSAVRVGVILAVSLWLGAGSASAETPAAGTATVGIAAGGGAIGASAQRHPLAPWVEYAAARYAAVRRELADYTCLLVKRERLGGRLSPYEFLATQVRLQQVRNRLIAAPFSVYVEYLGPARVRGRKVIYVAGRNEGKMLVRVGGERFQYLRLAIDPESGAARRESHYSVAELSLDTMILRLIEQGRKDMSLDPRGANTAVSYFVDAKVDGRLCTRVRVVHPAPQTGLVFHVAHVYIDNQLQLPIRIEGYDWPEREGGEPPLIEEYTFTQLRTNVGLTDAHFSPDRLD